MTTELHMMSLDISLWTLPSTRTVLPSGRTVMRTADCGSTVWLHVRAWHFSAAAVQRKTRVKLPTLPGTDNDTANQLASSDKHLTLHLHGQSYTLLDYV